MPRWARGRKDANHDDLVSAAERLGWDVIHTYQLRGFVDAVAWHPQYGIRLLEFKVPKTGKATKAQERLQSRGWPVYQVTTAEQLEMILQFRLPVMLDTRIPVK